MKKIMITLAALCGICFGVQAQNVNIPDANFKAYLLSQAYINTDANVFEISNDEAAAYSGSLSVLSKSVQSLVGIEAFVNITSFYCMGNYGLTSLDLSHNLKLTRIDCYQNGLESLDVSGNVLLTSLNCLANRLTTLDVSTNTALEKLNCSANSIQSLDLSKNSMLIELDCQGNVLKSLDVSLLINLEYLLVTANSLDSIAIVKNPKLKTLRVGSNSLTYLDVSQNLSLTQLYSGSNTGLSCIKSLPSQDKTDWYKDAAVTYNSVCERTTGIEDELFKKSTKIIAYVYNIQGQEVSKDYQGMVIYKYTDGTTSKVMQE